MALCQRRSVITLFMHVYATHCYAESLSGTILGVCDYNLKDLYVVNTTVTSALFPAGYVSCANATGSDVGLCDICSCRENKVSSAAGVTVVGVVCVGSGDATICAGPDQHYCDCHDSAGCAVDADDGSSYNNEMSVGDNVGSNANVSDASAESNSKSSSSSMSQLAEEFADTTSSLNSSISIETSTDTSLRLNTSIHTPTSVNPSTDADSTSNTDSASRSADSSNDADSSSADSSSDGSIFESISPSSSFGSKLTGSMVVNDNVPSNVAGTASTDAALSTDQKIVHPQENGSMLGTNNGSSTKSSWSGEHLTTMLSAIGGIGIVAVIVVFVVMRHGQSKTGKDVGTPRDEYADDDNSIVTPTNHGDRGSRYYSEGDCDVDSFKNTPLASIAVIGTDNAFPSIKPKHQYASYPGAGLNASDDSYARTDSCLVGKSVLLGDSRLSFAAVQQQFLGSHGPSVSYLQSSSSNTIYDTSTTRESFSSGISFQFESERVCELESSFNSFQMAYTTSCQPDRNSDISMNSNDRQALFEPESATVSSFSSLESVQFEIRDTEASEHMRESEMDTNSSRITFSFEMDSI